MSGKYLKFLKVCSFFVEQFYFLRRSNVFLYKILPYSFSGSYVGGDLKQVYCWYKKNSGRCFIPIHLLKRGQVTRFNFSQFFQQRISKKILAFRSDMENRKPFPQIDNTWNH